MNANAETFNDNRTATATDLARSGGLDGSDLSTSTFSLVLKHLPERAQSRVVGGQGQVVVASHKREGQILNRNIAIGVDDPARRLMPEVAAGVGDALMQNGDLPGRLAPISATLPAAGQATLGNPQGGEIGTQPAWVVDDCSIRERQQMMQSNVDADIESIGLNRRNIGQLQHQANVPLAERTPIRRTLHNDMLDRCVIGNRPVKYDLDLPHVLNVEPVGVELAPVTIAVFDRAKPFGVLEAGMTGAAFVERLVSLIDAAKHLLDRRGVERPHFVGQAVAFVAHPIPLLDVGHRPARPLPCLAALVERVVVDGLHLPKKAIQKMRLLLRRAKSIFVRADHCQNKTVRLRLFGCHTQTGQAGRLSSIFYPFVCDKTNYSMTGCGMLIRVALCAAHIPLPDKSGSTLRGFLWSIARTSHGRRRTVRC